MIPDAEPQATGGHPGVSAEVMAAAGRALVDSANESGATLRLMGGIGIWARASSDTRALLTRDYEDLDVASDRGSPKLLTDVFTSLGYLGEQRFNALHGGHRLIYSSADGDLKVDVFRNRFQMCHKLDLRGRLALDDLTVSPADLLLTKLQVVQVNRKDLFDICMLLIDHPLSNQEAGDLINVDRIVEVCADDWGWFTTVIDNIDHASRHATDILRDEKRLTAVLSRLAELRDRLEAAPKTRRWRLRARLGRRVAWYDTPDEVG